MVDQRRFALRSVILLLAAGLFVFLLYLYFFVPLSDVVQTLQEVNPLYFLFATCALLISAAFYSLAWKSLLNMLSVKASFLKAFAFIWIASFVDILVPAESISGDVSRIYLMSREPGGNSGKVVASVVSQRILATLVTATSLIISTLYFAFVYSPPLLIAEVATIIAVGSVLSIGLLLYLSIKRETTEKIVNWLIKSIQRLSRGHWGYERLRDPAMKMLGTFHEGIMTLSRHPKGLILPLLFSILAWLSDVLIAILVFLSLGPLQATISISAIVIVYSISVAVHYIPIVSGELGIVEIVMTSLFTLLGNPHAVAIFAAATILIRILTLWARLFIGGLVVQTMGIKNLVGKQRKD